MKFDTSMSKSAIPEERLHMTDPVCTGEVSPPKCDTVHYRLTPVTESAPIVPTHDTTAAPRRDSSVPRRDSSIPRRATPDIKPTTTTVVTTTNPTVKSPTSTSLNTPVVVRRDAPTTTVRRDPPSTVVHVAAPSTFSPMGPHAEQFYTSSDQGVLAASTIRTPVDSNLASNNQPLLAHYGHDGHIEGLPSPLANGIRWLQQMAARGQPIDIATDDDVTLRAAGAELRCGSGYAVCNTNTTNTVSAARA